MIDRVRPSEGSFEFPRHSIPESNRFVPPSPTASERGPIRAEGYAFDLVGMPDEGGFEFPCHGIPELHRVSVLPIASVVPSGLNAIL